VTLFAEASLKAGVPAPASQLGEVETTLHDASASLGHDIEIHVDNHGLRDFFGMVRDGADGWDGGTAPPGRDLMPIARSVLPSSVEKRLSAS
jgi:hypothetical protein